MVGSGMEFPLGMSCALTLPVLIARVALVGSAHQQAVSPPLHRCSTCVESTDIVGFVPADQGRIRSPGFTSLGGFPAASLWKQWENPPLWPRVQELHRSIAITIAIRPETKKGATF